ncbi:uncharacterized protein LOC135927828 isoform X2 [Gordionus sp. m RMFG-2023]|uniref:uncharacterized protein LOC135927828 isoform X2 n=1 Tax=Gordionus sp. m RMFG-2023 TaxID=3053472 RepID=UPI0031FD9407
MLSCVCIIILSPQICHILTKLLFSDIDKDRKIIAPPPKFSGLLWFLLVLAFFGGGLIVPAISAEDSNHSFVTTQKDDNDLKVGKRSSSSLFDLGLRQEIMKNLSKNLTKISPNIATTEGMVRKDVNMRLVDEVPPFMLLLYSEEYKGDSDHLKTTKSSDLFDDIPNDTHENRHVITPSDPLFFDRLLLLDEGYRKKNSSYMESKYFSLLKAENEFRRRGGNYEQPELIDRHGKYDFESIVATKPDRIVIRSPLNIEIHFNTTKSLTPNTAFNELILYGERLYNQSNLTRSIIPSEENHFIKVCLKLSRDDFSLRGSCTYQTLSSKSKYDIIVVNISSNFMKEARNTGFLILTVELSRNDSEPPSMNLDQIYNTNISSKYGPFLITYQNYDDETRFKRKNNVILNHSRIKRHISSDYKYCQLREWYIDFSTLGWKDWLIKPDGYYINYCTGICVSPLLNENYNASMHAFIKDLWLIATKSHPNHDQGNRNTSMKGLIQR